VVLQMFTLPWLIPPAALVLLVLLPEFGVWWWWSLGLACLAVVQQWLLRLWNRRRFDLPMRHWWLMGAGGVLVGLIGPVSVWRTLTGRGWTWKGRALAE
jgi:H+/Cl- antiporter ClcA